MPTATLPSTIQLSTTANPTGNEEDTIIASEVIELAGQLLAQALRIMNDSEKAQAKQMAGLISDAGAKSLSMTMTDRLIRSENPARSAAGWRAALSRFGLPRGFSRVDRSLLSLGSMASRWMPGLVMKAVQKRLRHDSRSVILPAEDAPLRAYLAGRKRDGIRTNVNQLGEAVLGEAEAGHRMEAVLSLLARSDVDYVSVKLSAIYSQIHAVAFEESLAAAKQKLRALYRAALPGGKFVNLDMEEYRDLSLTMAAFCSVLEEPEFINARAGIVLQAYLPDSWDALQTLTAWALNRVASGGSPVKVRLVKGANLAMESVEAELHGWAPAPYATKVESDANFRRMLDYACRPEHVRAVRIGVASHNLFDVSLALVLRERRCVGDAVEIEMLEGMANHQARAVRSEAGDLLVYAPVVKSRDFGAALAYLIRRLDENTSSDNYLSGLFSFTPGSAAWLREQERFLKGWHLRRSVASESRRSRGMPAGGGDFGNEPDTDYTQPHNRNRLWSRGNPAEAFGPLPAEMDKAGIENVLARSVSVQPAWESVSEADRAAILQRCGDIISERRFEIIHLLRTEGKKAVLDGDAEVSEAVDFARYYAVTGRLPAGVSARARGTVVITPPWNFPFAIPCGGVLAALMAGNAVVLKPAPETPQLGWMLANLLWTAGVPRGVLQFVTCDDGETGKSLICDPRTSAVVLTGGYDTARLFQSWRPSLPLFAETSGKNSLIVSAMADRDLAVKDLVRSAFGHAGQKCSAASLGILEAEVYDDPAFRRQLRDAAASLTVGPAAHPGSVVTPLIREPGESLRRALTRLDDGEEWLLQPRQSDSDPCLWSPGIKLGVKAGSWFHQTECFGPVLGLMRARDLEEAMRFQNGVSYGLTAGIHSLDESEIDQWRQSAEAGNLYINRPITGAIVQRQPFGGWKRSSIGPGSKAGGPNYVNLFRKFEEAGRYDAAATARHFATVWREHFALAHDPAALRCERNVFRYRPCRGVILRLAAADELTEAVARLAAETSGVSLSISRATEEPDGDFAKRLPSLAATAEFLRTVTPPSDDVLAAAHAAGLNWIDAPASFCARLELTRWVREQSVSETRHRYGNPLPP